MPLRPEKVWKLLQAARAGTLEQPDPVVPAIFNGTGATRQEGAPGFEEMTVSVTLQGRKVA